MVTGRESTGQHVLLVNDDHSSAAFQQGLLEKAGKQVTVCFSAVDAVNTLQQISPPDLIVSDLYMPGMDGFRFCRLLRSSEFPAYNDIPILVVSATYAGENPERLAADLGANAFTALPIDGRKYLATVEALLAGEAVTHHPTACIIEDSSSVSFALQKAFASRGYQVSTAHSIAEARTLLANRAYEVIVVDYWFVDGTGDSLLVEYFDSLSDSVWVMMTADPDPELSLNWLQQGASAYIRKPFSPAYLIEVCEKARREKALVSVHELLEARTQQLKTSEEQYRRLAEEMPVYISRFLPDGTYTYVNAALAGMLGKQANELLGTSVYTSFNEGLQDKLRNTLAALSIEQSTASVEQQVVDLQGRQRWQEWTNTAFYDDEGRLTHYQSIGQDITERKQHFDWLHFQATILDNITDLITVTDMDGKILYANRAVQAIFDRSLQDFVGQSVRIFGESPSAFPKQQDLIEKARQQGFWQGDMINILPGGEEMILDTRIQVMTDGENPDSMVGISTNITGRVRAEEALRETNQQLEQTLAELRETQRQVVQQERLAAVGQLSAGIAHDFRNLLNTILLNAEIALLGDSSPQQSHNMQIIIDESRKAADLVQQILDFSSRSMLQTTILDLAELLQDTNAVFNSVVPENIKVSIHASENSLFVKADPGRLEQALMNLVLNARDAMPLGGNLVFDLSKYHAGKDHSAPRAEIAAGDWVCLKIMDDGEGIPASVKDRIFEPFFTTKEVGKGTGLGLAQVYGIVRQHDGYIMVESEAGKGASFSIYLPLYANTLPQVVHAAADAVPVRGQGETILLVEDNPRLREAGQNVLEYLGYRVLTAENGEHALSLYRADRSISLVITDIIMPGMGGEKLAEKLKQINPLVRILGVTGYSVPKDTDDLRKTGFAGIVYKPYEVHALAQKVHAVLQRGNGRHAALPESAVVQKQA